jgi:hypothetical protein
VAHDPRGVTGPARTWTGWPVRPPANRTGLAWTPPAARGWIAA